MRGDSSARSDECPCWSAGSGTAVASPASSNYLPLHLKRAIWNGVTKDELIELITHLAFYAGWPPANTAIGIARQVFTDSERLSLYSFNARKIDHGHHTSRLTALSEGTG